MPRLWAKTASFDTISVGDELPILVKWETEETIKRFRSLASPSEDLADSAQETADETASEPAGERATAQPVSVWAMAFTAYVAELLEKAFKLPNIVAKGSQLDLEILQPVNPGDTLVLSGSVVDKRVEQESGLQELRLVVCQVVIENQSGETVASADVLVSL